MLWVIGGNSRDAWAMLERWAWVVYFACAPERGDSNSDSDDDDAADQMGFPQHMVLKQATRPRKVNPPPPPPWRAVPKPSLEALSSAIGAGAAEAWTVALEAPDPPDVPLEVDPQIPDPPQRLEAPDPPHMPLEASPQMRSIPDPPQRPVPVPDCPYVPPEAESSPRHAAALMPHRGPDKPLVSAKFLIELIASNFDDPAKTTIEVPLSAMTVKCNWNEGCDNGRWIAMAWSEFVVYRAEVDPATARISLVPSHRITNADAHITLAYMKNCTVEDIPRVREVLLAKLRQLSTKKHNHFQGTGQKTIYTTDEDYMWLDLHVTSSLYATCCCMTSLLASLEKLAWRRPSFHASFASREGTEIQVITDEAAEVNPRSRRS